MHPNKKSHSIVRDWKHHVQWALPVLIVLIAMIIIWQIQVHRHLIARQKASMIYTNIIHHPQSEDTVQRMKQLLNRYPQTPYADLAAFYLTRQAVMHQDLKKASHYMQQVMRQGYSPIFRQLATLRYARILVQEKQFYTALTALNTLDHSSLFALAALVKGHIYQAIQQPNQAQQAFQTAYQHLTPHPLKGLTHLLQTSSSTAG